MKLSTTWGWLVLVLGIASWAAAPPSRAGSKSGAPEVQDSEYIAGYSIMTIEPGSIYEKIGLQSGDVILKVNGKALTEEDDPAKILAVFNKPGQLTLEVLRNSKPMVLKYDVKSR